MRKPHPKELVVVTIVLCASPALAQQQDVSFGVADQAPSIDGVLDDDVWESTEAITDFRQVEPVEGGMPSGKTVVYLTHDEEMIYVGARLFDSDPRGIIARELQRDGSGIFGDDQFMIAFDTFLDQRNGLHRRLRGVLDAGDRSRELDVRLWRDVRAASGLLERERRRDSERRRDGRGGLQPLEDRVRTHRGDRARRQYPATNIGGHVLWTLE